MIPVVAGAAVSADNWKYSAGRPTSITWHWTATTTRKSCDITLGGEKALRKGEASAHYCVGRSESEGISQYVDLENRSWHAGVGQLLDWTGKQKTNFTTASRVSIGVETVNVGFARDGFPKQDDWIECFSTNGKTKMFVQPWTDEQIDMMVFVGKEIIKKYPNITVFDNHGHMDICPGYKDDCSLAFPFAKVLSGMYDTDVPDVWSKYRTVLGRQEALIAAGYNLGSAGADGEWGRLSDAALRQFQRDRKLDPNGFWSTFVCWEMHYMLEEKTK